MTVEPLAPEELGTYFALMEAVSLLQHGVEQQLRADGGISYVQFQLLARLTAAPGPLTMTQLADGVVYSRSGLTYQAGLLEKAGLIERGASTGDERATLVSLTGEGRALVERILPGHVGVTRRLLFDTLETDDVARLGDIMTRVRDHMRAGPPRSAAPRKNAAPRKDAGQPKTAAPRKDAGQPKTAAPRKDAGQAKTAAPPKDADQPKTAAPRKDAGQPKNGAPRKSAGKGKGSADS